MKRTILSAVTLLSLLLAVVSYAACNGPGKARWSIKTSVPENTNLDKSTFFRLEKLLALEAPPDVTKNDKRYDSAIIPVFHNSLNLKEGDIVSTSGWLHLVATEDNDCDYHIQISNDPNDGNNCLIVEVPKDDEAFVTSKEIRDSAKKVREFIRSKLLKGKEPGGGNVMDHPPYVKVTGQLFYDDAHVGDRPRGKKDRKHNKVMHAATLWEIHPVTAIEFAPVSRK